MKTIKNNWKVALIVAVGIITIILLGVFCIQSSQNRAFTLEEQVNTADSDIKAVSYTHLTLPTTERV